MKSVLQIEFIRYFLLTRPYSWLSVSFVAVLASIFVNTGVLFPEILIDLIFGILVWISANLFAERLSRDMVERGKIFLPIPVFLFVLAVLIAIFRNPLVLLVLLFILIALFIYGTKNKFYFIGQISFFIRGLMEFFLFISILLFYNFQFVSTEWLYLLFWVYFITCGRNLVGDLRDIKYDKKTLPKSIGVLPSRIVVLILYLFPLIFGGLFLISHLVALLLIIFFKEFYNLHKALVLVNMFIFFELAVYLVSKELLVVTAFLFFGILLSLLYDKVPRKSNPFENKK